MEEEKMEEQQEKQKKKSFWNNKKIVKGKALSAWVIVMILIFMLFTFGLGLFLGKELFAKDNSNGGKPSNNAEPANTEANTIDKNIEEKTKSFIAAAMYSNDGGDGIAVVFTKGINKLSADEKAIVTYNSLVNVKNENKEVTVTPDKYKSEDDYWQGATITELSIESFKNEYKEFFKEEVNLSSIKVGFFGCPFVYKMDEELGNFYLSNQCGGTGSPVYQYKTYETSEDDNYYYVKQYVGTERYTDDGSKEYKKVKSDEVVNVTSFEGNENKFETVVWKFDKNFNFVSTENIG